MLKHKCKTFLSLNAFSQVVYVFESNILTKDFIHKKNSQPITEYTRDAEQSYETTTNSNINQCHHKLLVTNSNCNPERLLYKLRFR
jgi:hypothetical protein